MRKQIAAANWKMNLTLQQAEALVDELLATPFSLNENQQAVFGVPFPYLIAIHNKFIEKNSCYVSAQNCYTKESGAYTGETSVEMLTSIGITHVIIGHSERREFFNESNAMLAEKINCCLSNNLKPIFCCGEPLQIREAESQNSFVETQLKESLFQLTAEQITNFIIAYEPIWAIGTGKTASNEQAQQMHKHIRTVLANNYGLDVANTISILYGGSVKANNAGDIFAQPDVDGGLVGGASLVAADFAVIINSLKK
jgi:triosephosphate isomerase